ncbi:MAG TPA: glutamine--fructose-6-phosphate aminotransferase, partial [Halobacteriales archaeon]|nr:glutamine--fructose-6-phosphate aminotransferase [Halobacteriales archaeon]
MCGIIGCVGRDADTLDVLLDGLANLEYRGYDSAGIALADGSLSVVKRAGELSNLQAAVDGTDEPLTGSVGIGHTRWSTHGPPTDDNAHPHVDCTGSVAVIHNGIIENYQSIRDDLEAAGHDFLSETDTEVIPHLIEEAMADGADFLEAFRDAIGRLEGSYAVAAVASGEDAVLAARRGSPLVLGVGDDAYYLGSDVPAFLAETNRVVYVEDGEIARLDPDGWSVTDGDGEPVAHEVRTVDWDPEETGKGGYDHYMLKEIHEQPRSLRQCIQGRVDELAGSIEVEELSDVGPVDAV